MPRIRWPIGSEAHTNAVMALQKLKNPTSSHPQSSPKSVPIDPGPNHAPRKRKSTESAASASPAAKKARTPSRKPASKTSKEAASELLDVSNVSIPLEDVDDDDNTVHVYDTCDTVRDKIRAFLAKDGISQAAFLRAIVTAAYGADSSKKMQSVSLNGFLKQRGPLSGNASAVYYASYVFFEKLRIKRGEPKSDDREVMEEVHPNGVNTKVPFGRISYVTAANTILRVNRYGIVITV
ncbi:hypothetical protein OQA88_13458 [Cercophora sp. LCS_1]